MRTTRDELALRLAPDVPDLEALGATCADDFLAEPPRLATIARATRKDELWRVPLPGTPDGEGRQHERLRGAGTGFVLVRRWRGGGLELARARFTNPRSTSLAARHWNLACHLQAHGVVTRPLVAMGEHTGTFASRASFLVVRELAGFVPLSRWLADARDAAERRRGLQALGHALAALFRSGTWLPRTRLDNVLIAGADGDCAAIQLVNLRSELDLLRERGLQRAGKPAIAFTGLARGRVFTELEQTRRLRLLRALARQAAPTLTLCDLAGIARAVVTDRSELCSLLDRLA